jgi:hypothetical protein
MNCSTPRDLGRPPNRILCPHSNASKTRLHLCCLVAIALSDNRTNIVDRHAVASYHQQRIWHHCSPLIQSNNTMQTSVPHSGTAGVGKRFAALKKAFQRATGAGFTEMSQQACTSQCLCYSQCLCNAACS